MARLMVLALRLWAASCPEFGINRVMRALEPPSANLDAVRWRGARACLLAMLDAAAKQARTGMRWVLGALHTGQCTIPSNSQCLT